MQSADNYYSRYKKISAMCLLEKQIELINQALQTKLFNQPVFSGAKLYGIATDATRNDDSKTVVNYPIIISPTGGCKQVSYDDRYPLMLYHRLVSKTYTPTKTAIGDSANILTERTEMKLVVTSSSTAIGLSPYALESLVVSALPDNIAPATCTLMKIRRMLITPLGSIADSMQVFREEYRGVDPFVVPGLIMFSLRYTIESDYQKGCFTILDC
jgi:hypothetical protein